MSLKQKTVSGLSWSFVDYFSIQGISFVIGVILARLLTPREFGLIGMTTVFIAISRSFIDSGFTQALIRKQNCTQTDYSTVFYFNLVVSIIFYIILFFTAGAIGRFFDEPKLQPIVRMLGLGLIIHAFTIIQRARLTKRIDFKLQTRVSIIAVSIAGIIGVFLAFKGYGVWALVFKTLILAFITSLLLWRWNRWAPSLVFSWQSFRELFSFGSKLLISGLIDTVYRNIYLLVIGKYYSAVDLGFYTRAKQFKDLLSNSITSVIQRVSYPVLSTIQDDIPRLKASYRKLIKSTMLLTLLSMMVLAAVAESLVLTLIGEQWLSSVIYLQLLCFVGMFYPLQAINLNMLNVQGRSDLFLKLEIIKKIMAVPVIVIGIIYGIKIMIIGMIFNSIIAYLLNSYYSGRYLGYSSFQQIKDILPSFFLATIIGALIFIAGLCLKTLPPVTLMIQVFMAGVLALGTMELIKMESYLFIKGIILEKFLTKKHETK